MAAALPAILRPMSEHAFLLPDAVATERLGADLSHLLRAGDTVLLSGDLGAGKSHLARAIVQSLQARSGPVEDVPSPTYTLVQSYRAGETDIVHADLYRVGDPSELVELGLEEAMGAALCLIEWPDRLDDIPAGALRIELAPEGDGRRVVLSGEGWDDRLAALWTAGAAVAPLAGDASRRRYRRLSRNGETAILMENGGDIAPFLRVAAHISARGLSAPAILRADPARGRILLEDLGDDTLSRIAGAEPSRVPDLYAAATDVLVALHSSPPPAWVKPYGPAEMAAALAPAFEHYAPGTGPVARAKIRAQMQALLAALAPETSVLVHRDYHAENLLWLPARRGPARIGLLDFQDALAGHPAYDLVSLLQDARRDVAPEIEVRMIARYCDATGRETERFRAAYALQGAQRHIRILGIFARLSSEAGKPGYLRLLPRVWRHLLRCLEHPELRTLREPLLEHLPAPDAMPA